MCSWQACSMYTPSTHRYNSNADLCNYMDAFRVRNQEIYTGLGRLIPGHEQGLSVSLWEFVANCQTTQKANTGCFQAGLSRKENFWDKIRLRKEHFKEQRPLRFLGSSTVARHLEINLRCWWFWKFLGCIDWHTFLMLTRYHWQDSWTGRQGWSQSQLILDNKWKISVHTASQHNSQHEVHCTCFKYQCKGDYKLARQH